MGGLLITDPAAPQTSRTKDIDLVVEIANYAEFEELGAVLRKAGFTQSPLENMPIEAWRWKGVRVDFLHHKPIVREANHWLSYLVEEAEPVEVLPGKSAWCSSAPCFLATKFEAFFSRGGGDYLMSKDIEDILAVVDGRVELLDEIRTCAYDVRGFLSECSRRILADQRFMDCLPRIVPDNQRETVVANRLREVDRSM